MAEEVLKALSRPLPELPSKFFFDENGCFLFDVICQLPEYYLGRSEEKVLQELAAEVVNRQGPSELVVVGQNYGNNAKLFLEAMESRGLLERCQLFDFNEHSLRQEVQELMQLYDDCQVEGVVGDYQKDITELGPGGERLVLFLGNHLGNLRPGDMVELFIRMREQMEPGDSLLVGLDLVKEGPQMVTAYTDPAGVVAQFNLNLLRVVNANLGANFDPSGFDHLAFYDEQKHWVELRLRATRPMLVYINELELKLNFAPGDELRTIISAKFTQEDFIERVTGTGFELAEWSTDDENQYAVAWLRAVG